MKLESVGTKLVLKLQDINKPIEGLFIPDAYIQREMIGVVVSIGEYVDLLEVNDVVMFKKCAGIDVVIDNEDYLVIDESDIVAKVTYI